MTKLLLLACQIEISETRNRASRDRHVDSLIEKIDRHLSREPVDLVVLPELSSIEYSRAAFNQLAEISDSVDGAGIDSMKDLAARHNTHIVFGVPRHDGGQHYISMLVIGPQGDLIGHYDKLHVAQFGVSMEKEFFQRGSGLLVFDIGGFRVAPIICYDIRFPELCRALCRDHGVHLILHSSAFGRDEAFYSWHHFAVTRAMENQCFFASLNRAGESFGKSIICSPWVDENHPPIRFGIEEELKRVELDMSVLDSVRANYTFGTDLREDYRSLTVVSNGPKS
jgi:predicted amidohydrolase